MWPLGGVGKSDLDGDNQSLGWAIGLHNVLLFSTQFFFTKFGSILKIVYRENHDLVLIITKDENL